MTESLGVAIVGAGFIADSHAAAIAAHPNTRLVAVHDRDPGAAGRLAGQHGAVVHAEFDALLADPAVDAVILGTPSDTHAPLATAIAEAGKHLLLEKPLALTRDDAQRVTQAYADRDLVLLVGHTHRHSDYAQAVASAIAGGAIGEPRSMRLAITGGWIWPNWGAWMLDPERSGGHALHNGVHLYDLARWWMDAPIVRAHSLGQRVTSGALSIDDALVATLEHANGAASVCEISRGERPRSTSVFEIVVHGTTGTLTRRWDSDGTVAFSDGGAGPVPAGGNSPFTSQLAVLHDAIVLGTPISPANEDAVHAVAVAEAVEASSSSGRVESVASPKVGAA